MGAVVNVGAVVLPYALIFGITYATGLLVRQLIAWAKYHFNDGPTVDRLRALTPEIRACRNGLLMHYESEGVEGISPYRRVAETTALMFDGSVLLRQVIGLGIDVPSIRPNWYCQ